VFSPPLVGPWRGVEITRRFRAKSGGEIRSSMAIASALNPDALLAHRSPMGCAHISLTGDYLWADAVAAGGFRPLNNPADRLYRAA